MTAPDPTIFRLRDHFIGWQCRIRQHAMREDGGRPPIGACPRIEGDDGTLIAERAILTMVKRESADDIAQMRHLVSRTNDPSERYTKGLEFLSSAYYQQARSFSDLLCGLFAANSPAALHLLGEGCCVLHFAQFQQTYRVPCTVTEAARDDTAWQATYWHNALFNPKIPPDIRILLFKGKWVEASAEPPLPH